MPPQKCCGYLLCKPIEWPTANLFNKMRVVSKPMFSTSYPARIAGLMFILLIVFLFAATILFDFNYIPESIENTLVTIMEKKTNAFASFFYVFSSPLGCDRTRCNAIPRS